MRYGTFDDENREYVITQPDTPLPWINYLGTEDYFGLISNTAGGYSFYKDARLRRLTRYRYNNAPLDMGGRYIYLRDNDHNLFWSPSWMPTRTKLDKYECRHGMGYTKISSTYKGITAQMRYFVPIAESLEIWEVHLLNERQAEASLDLFSAVEFALWDALDDATNFQRNYSLAEVEVPHLAEGDGGFLPAGSTIFHKTEYRERRNHFAFFACSEPLDGFDTQREDFLGAYRGWDDPEAVAKGRSKNSVAHGWQPMGSHHLKIDLKPGESKNIIFLLGYHENDKNEKYDPQGSNLINKRGVWQVIEKYLKPENVKSAFGELKGYWDNLLGRLSVDTPDVHTNRMVNIWNAYQCMVTFNLSRSASYFESGVGRGMGFRDSNQDLLGFMHMIPDRARERILDLASTQLEDGGAFHQYQPLTKRGNDAVGTGFNDDPLWLVLAVTAYIKETGDLSILDESIPYENTPGTEKPMMEHLHRAMGYTLNNLGPHRLPLIGRADWNDCLNLNCFSEIPGESFQTTTQKTSGVAESVFIAGLFILACDEMAALIDHQGAQEPDAPASKQTAKFYKEKAEQMTKVVWESGWDGAWFRRAYDAFGDPIGSERNEQGKIFIEPQGICVMAGLGIDNGKAQQALDSVAEHLATPHGIVLHQPAYTQYDLKLGEITSYPPGYKENAGVFSHNNPWIVIAETKIGRGDRALDYYLRINPSAREGISEVHRCEPYVYAQMIAGKDAPSHGEAKNSWLTGSASWNFVAISQHILGIRTTYEGLMVAPVIPLEWQGFEAKRKFRGVTYLIHVERKGPGNTVQLIVDGKPIEGNTIPLTQEGTQRVKVKAILS